MARTPDKITFPSREDILKFVAENPSLATRRDIARAFKIKGNDKVALKRMLKQLMQEGALAKTGKRMRQPGTLPPVSVLNIVGQNSDGELRAAPTNEPDSKAKITISIRGNRNKVPRLGDRVLARLTPNSTRGKTQDYTAKVIKILPPEVTQTKLGIVAQDSKGRLIVESVDRRNNTMFIDPDRLNGASDQDIVEWDTSRGSQQAGVLRIVGSVTNHRSLAAIAIHNHEIPDRFSQAVLDEAERQTPAQLDSREDWRQLPLITIDPADARDHDDAVYAEPDKNQANPGGVIVYVAIADVAHYVRPNSLMDKEAQRRGNSVYFPAHVVPMLPERISNDLCSLREGEDRPAICARMVFSNTGRKIDHQFYRILMKSHAKLSYHQAQAIADGKPDRSNDGRIDKVIHQLWTAYRVLLKGRQKREPLEIEVPERQIRFDENGNVAGVVLRERFDAHKLIEEFMIQANVAAAQTLEKQKQHFVYRVHAAPPLAKQERLRLSLDSIGIPNARKIDMTPGGLNKVLADGTQADLGDIVGEIVLRSQSQAEYSPNNIGHFGLNLQRYAHFTSPIRRYADLIVHRALVATVGDYQDGLVYDPHDLAEIAEGLSICERRAQSAERETIDRLVANYLGEQQGAEFGGRVSGISKSGLFVTLTETGADGFVPASTLGDDYYRQDESAMWMYGERSGKGYQLTQKVDVRLAEIHPAAGSLRFEMLSAPVAVPRSTRSFHKSNVRRRRFERSGRRRR